MPSPLGFHRRIDFLFAIALIAIQLIVRNPKDDVRGWRSNK
jgi:hypothetical protein